jgi:hypothetical protein
MEAVRALYTPDPTEAEASSWGLTVAEASGPPVGVWPENWPAVQTFAAMGGQWRVGPGGVYALDYSALPAVRHLAGPRSEWPDTFEAIRAMEAEALEIMESRRKK